MFYLVLRNLFFIFFLIFINSYNWFSFCSSLSLLKFKIVSVTFTFVTVDFGVSVHHIDPIIELFRSHYTPE